MMNERLFAAQDTETDGCRLHLNFADPWSKNGGKRPQTGMINIDYAVSPLPFIETDATGYYAIVGAGFYPVDNLCLSCSYTHALDNGLFQGEIEWQTPMDGLSLFARLARGDNDYDHALAGIRWYFGKQKSLKLRHREDDPPNVLNSMMTHIGTYGAEFNRKADEFFAGNNIPAGSGGGYGVVISVIGSGVTGADIYTSL